jgi:hypothetical protein
VQASQAWWADYAATRRHNAPSSFWLISTDPRYRSSTVHRFSAGRTIRRSAEHTHDVQPRHDVSDRLLQLAAMQAHVVTRDQALGHGLTRHSISRLLESGAWRRLARGLFLTVPLEPSWDSLAWAGVLLGGQFARLGPESSGFLYQLLPEAPDPLDVLVPRKRRVELTAHGSSSVRRQEYAQRDRCRILRGSRSTAPCSTSPMFATPAR